MRPPLRRLRARCTSQILRAAGVARRAGGARARSGHGWRAPEQVRDPVQNHGGCGAQGRDLPPDLLKGEGGELVLLILRARRSGTLPTCGAACGATRGTCSAACCSAWTTSCMLRVSTGRATKATLRAGRAQPRPRRQRRTVRGLRAPLQQGVQPLADPQGTLVGLQLRQERLQRGLGLGPDQPNPRPRSGRAHPLVGHGRGRLLVAKAAGGLCSLHAVLQCLGGAGGQVAGQAGGREAVAQLCQGHRAPAIRPSWPQLGAARRHGALAGQWTPH